MKIDNVFALIKSEFQHQRIKSENRKSRKMKTDNKKAQ